MYPHPQVRNKLCNVHVRPVVSCRPAADCLFELLTVEPAADAALSASLAWSSQALQTHFRPFVIPG